MRRWVAAALFGWAGVSGAGAAEPPRLAGIVIAPGERIALFDVGQGALTRAEVGEEVGGFRVQSIERLGVRLEGGGRVALVVPSSAGGGPVQHESVQHGGAPFGLVLRAQPPVDD